MTGFLLLFVLGIWVAVSRKAVREVMKKINPKRNTKIYATVLFVVFMCLPVGDEIVGGIQFMALCDNNRVAFGEDEGKLNGITVFNMGAINSYMTDYALPIRRQHWRYADIKTGKEVIGWDVYHAKGGILIRTLGISETNSPLIFSGVCFPKESRSIFKRLNVTKITMEK